MLMGKPTIHAFGGFRRMPASLLLALVIAAGCAGAPHDRDVASSPPDEPEAVRAEPGDEIEAEAVLDETDPDVLFHVLAAERLGAVGDYEEALEHYLEAAAISEDPRVAERVTRLGASLQAWDAVIRGAGRWLELEPDERAARQVLVMARLQRGDVDEAAAEIAAIIEAAEEPGRAWQEAAVLIASAPEADSAWAVMDRLLDVTGEAREEAVALYASSLLAWQLDEAERALAMAEQAAALSGSRRDRIWAAQLAMAQGQSEQALAHYRAAREDAPGDIELALLEAEVLRQAERLDEALELLSGLPEDPDVLYTLGSYLREAGEQDEAVEIWHKLAVTPDEDQTRHAYNTALLAELLELREEAREWYERVESGPHRTRAVLRRAVLAGQAGDLLEARNLLHGLRLEGRGPQIEQAWLVEVELLREAERDGEALDVLSEALTGLPESISLLYARALTAVDLDDLELAEQDLRAILQLDPDNAMALNALGYTLADRTDRHREAYRLIRRALELEPDDPAVLDSMGWVYFRLGQPAEALPFLRRALAAEDNPEIAAHLGEVLWELGERGEARELLDEALDRFPGDPHLNDTRGRLGIDP